MPAGAEVPARPDVSSEVGTIVAASGTLEPLLLPCGRQQPSASKGQRSWLFSPTFSYLDISFGSRPHNGICAAVQGWRMWIADCKITARGSK